MSWIHQIAVVYRLGLREEVLIVLAASIASQLKEN
jgi:hypothetical protein